VELFSVATTHFMEKTMNANSFEKQTRSIFHDIHKKQGESSYIFNRLKDLLNPAFLKENKDFFKD